MNKIKYKRVYVGTPEALIERFERVCDNMGYTRAEAVRQALRDFIRKNEQVGVR